MKIQYYTITTNNFYQYTLLMIKSFIKFSHDKMYILTLDDIENKIDHPNIIHISCKHLFDQHITDNPNIVKKPPLGISCCWMKSRCVNFPELIDTDFLVYVDSDILFFENISEYILNTTSNNGDSVFYAANDGRIILDTPRINAGFYFTNLNKYPFIDLMNSWHNKMMELLPNRFALRKRNKILFKYFDQPILNSLLLNTEYSNYKTLNPYIIGYRRYAKNRVLSHYIKTHKRRMASDYRRFIDPS